MDARRFTNALCCGFALAPGAAAQFTIEPAVNYFAGTDPAGVAPADYDGDGDVDLATTVGDPDRVVILLNDGAGVYSIGSATNLPGGSSPQDLVAGDLDGDGDVDLSVALRDPGGTVTVLLNNGDATFALIGGPAVADRPVGLAIGDHDNDADLDLAVANRNSDSVSVLTNDGDGLFTAMTFTVGAEPRHTAFVDIDGDGALELAVTNHDDRTIGLYTSGGALIGTLLVGQFEPDGITDADLDSDGDVDLAAVASNPNTNLSVVAVYLNTGGVFSGPFVHNTGGFDSSRIVATDLDCDGLMDVATSNRDSNSVSLLRNTGGGAFGAPQLVAVGAAPGAIAAADLDNDAAADLVTANRDSNNVSALINATCAGGDRISFAQVDFYFEGEPVELDTTWGQFFVDYSQSAQLRWVNVVRVDTPKPMWIVQNHPLLSAEFTKTQKFSSTSYFDLGLAEPEDVVEIVVRTVVTDVPLREAPDEGATASVEVATSRGQTNSGVPSEQVELNPPSADLINWDVPFVGLKGTWHKGMPNVVQERNWCGPGSTANSLHWLAGDLGIDLGQTLEETQAELADLMDNDNNGNWDDKQVEGKEAFIAAHNLPLEVHYKGGVMLEDNGNITWEWLQEEMERGQDVELMTNTHWVVLEGLLHWDNIHLVGYRDDPHQNGDDTTEEERAEIEKRHVWTSFDPATQMIDIGNGAEVLQTAVAESPRPSCPGDADGDGDVDFNDLLIVLADWGCEEPPDCSGDVDDDDDVDFGDLLTVLANWGPCG